MFGTVTKTYWAEKMGIDPRKIVVVSVMPCTAKKFEKERPEMKTAFHYWQEKMGLKDEEAFKDVDCVLTTREAAKMIREAGIDFANLPDEDFDKPLGESSGAGVIFGATGGVMEAALRTAYEVLTKKSLAKLDFEDVRGLEGIKSADIDIDGTILKVAVANGLGNARVLMEQVQKGESPYHFIEIMCCPGGCLGGGGQPISKNPDIKKRRAEAIYREDAGKPIRKSHENPEITTIYKDFLGEPNSEKAHHLLHTEYCDRSCK
jgi:NADH-quinone oxidoreductase subunit G/NADP-reducing hydrogenase subunit HndD